MCLQVGPLLQADFRPLSSADLSSEPVPGLPNPSSRGSTALQPTAAHDTGAAQTGAVPDIQGSAAPSEDQQVLGLTVEQLSVNGLLLCHAAAWATTA